MLRLEGVDKRYPGVHALKDVSLAVRRGEVHAIVGENGAGKSTLVGVAAGTVARRQRRRSRSAASDRDAPTPRVVARARARDRLPGARAAARPDGRREHAARHARARCARAPASSTRGPRERLAPWRGAADDRPARVRARPAPGRALRRRDRHGAGGGADASSILDEPTEHLLPEGVEVLFARDPQEIERGAAVVYISHRIREVKQVADTITVLRDGALAGHVRGRRGHRGRHRRPDRRPPLETRVPAQAGSARPSATPVLERRGPQRHALPLRVSIDVRRGRDRRPRRHRRPRPARVPARARRA